MFVACAEEKKARAIQEAISEVMKRSGVEIRDVVEAVTNDSREGFILRL